MVYGKKQKGFTLLEVLLVVGAIGILAGIVVLAINPARQLAKLRNSTRTSNTRTILDAISQHSLDNGGLLLNQISTTNYQVLGTSATGCNMQCGTTGATGSSTTNIALNKPASASSSYPLASTTPAKANDGIATTFWINHFSSGTNNVWWRVDLGSEKSINKAGITWYNSAGTYNCNSLIFQGSNDDNTYNNILGPINTASSPQNAEYTFNTASYRYWRLFCNQGVNATFLLFREVALYESVDQPVITENACLDLSSELVPKYLTDIPFDPKFGGSNKTYYAVKGTGTGRLEVRSCSPELDEVIEFLK